MGKLVESTHVSLGGEIGSPQSWGAPYMNEEHLDYANKLLFGADVLLLGRRTYEGLAAGYTAMDRNAFVDRMNSIPKYVASKSLERAGWNATVIQGDLATFVRDLKDRAGKNILKYGTGPLDATLIEHNLVDEFHIWLTPVAVGRGQHLFDDVRGAPQFELSDMTRFTNGVVVLVYTPKSASA
ncbi:MAG TPA: dihydrofolate reductase family protein [Acidimicrobiales bacterium]|nr:dihydrofolate reductase family protein [Acidimicrobiales bacterium]